MIEPAVRVKLTGVTYVAHRDDPLLLAEQGQHPPSCHGQAHAKGANFLRAPLPSAPTPTRPQLKVALDTQPKQKVRG